MPKDKLVRTSRGVARIKPIKKVGKDEKGRLIQNFVVKNPDKSVTTTRYADAKQVDKNETPRKLRKKKIRKIRKKRVKLIKPGPTPKASNKMPKLDADDKKALAKINRNKQLAKQYNKRNKNVFTRLISKLNKGYGRPKGGVAGNKTS